MKGIARRNRSKAKAAGSEFDFADDAGHAVGAAPAGKHNKKDRQQQPNKRQAKPPQQQQHYENSVDAAAAAASTRLKINSRSNDPKDAAALRTLAAQRNRKGGRSTLLRATQQQQQQEISSSSAAAAKSGTTSSATTAAAASSSSSFSSSLSSLKSSSKALTANQRQQRQGDALLDSFRSRLSGSTFRLMNEQLYTTPSDFASQLLSNEPAYREYHDGYNRQLQLWPVTPVDIILESFRHSKKGRFDSAYHNMEQKKGNSSANKNTWTGIPLGTVVADFGCGNAQLAKSLNAAAEEINAVNQRKQIKNSKQQSDDGKQQEQQQQQQQATGFKIYSLDLYAEDPLVTACNMANTPLEDSSLDFAVFSLSLMSTNWIQYLIEAQRVLKKRQGYVPEKPVVSNNRNFKYNSHNQNYGHANKYQNNNNNNNSSAPSSGYGSGNLGTGGILKIVEVRSRMPDPDQFSKLVESLGFEFIWGDVVGEGYFCAFDFECVEKTVKRDIEYERSLPQPSDVLIPCLYKRR